MVRLKPGTSRSQVEHSTTEPIGKADMIRELGSYHICRSLVKVRIKIILFLNLNKCCGYSKQHLNEPKTYVKTDGSAVAHWW